MLSISIFLIFNIHCPHFFEDDDSIRFAWAHEKTTKPSSEYFHSAYASFHLQINMFFSSFLVSSNIGYHNVVINIFKSSKKLSTKSISCSVKEDCVGLYYFQVYIYLFQLPDYNSSFLNILYELYLCYFFQIQNKLLCFESLFLHYVVLCVLVSFLLHLYKLLVFQFHFLFKKGNIFMIL